MVYFLTVRGIGKNITLCLFDNRSIVSSFLAISIICLIIIRGYQIFRQKGMSAFKPEDNKFLGDIGELVIRAIEISAAMYSGFIVISLIILEKFPEEVPNEGLIFIFLSMLFLLVWSALHIYNFLILPTLSNPPGISVIKEIKDTDLKDIMVIMYCSNLTSEEIKKSYLPKTKDVHWYDENCIGEKEVPDYAITGRVGGTPFYTMDRKIMRSSKLTWDKLNIKRCSE